jgi:two-component system cell cycle sensor histidine kinase/response regulator CckA
MKEQRDRVGCGVEGLWAGDHACAIYEGEPERDATIVAWVRAGLERGEKLLCIVDARPAAELMATLDAAGLPVGDAVSRGQIECVGADGTYLRGGVFDGERMIRELQQALDDALAAGYPALRVCGEMGWVLRCWAGVGQLIEYETRVAELFEDQPLLGLCLYDRLRFGAADLLEQLRTHALVVLDGEVHASPYWLPSEALLEQQREEWELGHWLAHIREQTELLRSLQHTERRYRLLFDSLVSGYALHEMVFDAAGQAVDYRFIDINPAFEALTGLDSDRVLGRRVLEVLPGLEPEWIERYGRVVTSGEPTRFRMFSQPLQRHYDVVAYRPEPGHFATVFSDITEIVEAEERRIEAERRLFETQKLDSLGLLAGGIAHDFNNMLMGVLGNASLALDDAPPGSALEECLQDIETAAKNAAGLAKQLLAYSGRGRFVVEPVDVGAALMEMAKLLEASIPKSVRIRYQLDKDVGPVCADVSQLRQVLMNLILNAAQAIGERSGVITVATAAMDCDSDYLASTFAGEGLEAGRYLYLEVTDTGVGMDAETQRRIFDPFFSTKSAGRGLGLAATLGIVRGHHGAIKVYSELGRGSTFKILLPEHSEPVPQRVERAGLDEGFEASGTVLVVDDEEHVRRVASRILTRMGFDVLSAEDGREGVAIYRSHQDEIVLVLLDMMMPRMGGERTFTELRRIKPDVRVLLTSGYNEQDAVDRFVGRGLAGFIQKPYPKGELERAVREALG